MFFQRKKFAFHQNVITGSASEMTFSFGFTSPDPLIFQPFQPAPVIHRLLFTIQCG